MDAIEEQESSETAREAPLSIAGTLTRLHARAQRSSGKEDDSGKARNPQQEIPKARKGASSDAGLLLLP